MPELSRFYGIVITMYWTDHPVPHFHARYGDDSASFHAGTGQLIAGSLPRRAVRLVRQWQGMHRDELIANWHRARTKQPLEPIDPLP